MKGRGFWAAYPHVADVVPVHLPLDHARLREQVFTGAQLFEQDEAAVGAEEQRGVRGARRKHQMRHVHMVDEWVLGAAQARHQHAVLRPATVQNVKGAGFARTRATGVAQLGFCLSELRGATCVSTALHAPDRVPPSRLSDSGPTCMPRRSTCWPNAVRGS